MGFLLVEKTKDEVVAMLKANLATRLTALEAEYADGIDLPAPTDDDYYPYLIDPTVNTYGGGLPCLIVYAGRTTNEGEEVPDIVNWRHHLRVSYVWRSSTGDLATLDKVVERAARAIAELLYEQKSAISQFRRVSAVNYVAQVYSRATGDYLKEVVVELEVDAYEQA